MIIQLLFLVLCCLIGCQSEDERSEMDSTTQTVSDMAGERVGDVGAIEVPDAMGSVLDAMVVDHGRTDMSEAIDAQLVADMGTPVDAEVVADMGTPVDAEVVADMGTPVDAEVVADMGTPLDAEVVADMDTPVDAEVVADMMTVADVDAAMEAGCGEEAYFETIDGQSRCVQCRAPCVNGEVEVRVCGDSTDRACEQCPFETYDHDQDPQTACLDCTMRCLPGTEESQTCTAVTDRVCEFCIEGQFDHDRSPTTSCMDCSEPCEPGFTEVRGCAGILDRVCARCEPGTFDHDHDSSTVCVACTDACAFGETEARGCTAQGDRTCASCVAGFFDHDADPSTVCEACQVDCTAGSEQSQACTPTTDRRCDGCEDGQYLQNGSCEQCTQCPGGTYLTADCTPSTNTECMLCDPMFFDHDANALTACIACSPLCDASQFERVACSPTTDRACSGCRPGEVITQSGECEACALGTYDHDADEDTPCIDCTVCSPNQIRWGTCGGTQDVSCAACGSNPSDAVYPPVMPSDPPGGSCGPVDPDCTQVIDIVIFYTPAFFGMINEDLAYLEELASHVIHMANKSLEQSMLPPNMRYRFLGFQRFEYEERDELKSDLMWLRNNDHYQSIRRSWGADLGLFLLGTQGYGGYAYSNNSNAVADRERGIAVIDGYYLLGDFDRCGTTYETPAHELGHILGAAHRASMFQNPTETQYGYHNQEPLYRRNEAFGLPVDQHDLQFYTLMSYGSYKNEFDRITGCLTCQQLSVFSSPNLWWFFDPIDPLYGYCLEIQVNGEGQVELVCNGADAWVVEDGEYVINMDVAHRLAPENLLQRAVPLGVDQPTHLDPQDGVTPITEPFSTRNRERVESRWHMKATNVRPLAALDDCPLDCQAVYRITCAVGRQVCGDCLPGYVEDGDNCLGRVELHSDDAVSDGKYLRSDVSLDHSEDELVLEVALSPGATVHRIELYLMTLDELGELDYSWVDIGATIWVASQAPSHAFTLYAVRANGEEIEVGNASTPEIVINDASPQKDHILSYGLTLSPAVDDVTSIKLVLESESAFGFNISELRVFGE